MPITVLPCTDNGRRWTCDGRWHRGEQYAEPCPLEALRYPAILTHDEALARIAVLEAVMRIVADEHGVPATCSDDAVPDTVQCVRHVNYLRKLATTTLAAVPMTGEGE